MISMKVLAFETNVAQAEAVRHVVADLVGAQLLVVASTDALLEAIRLRTPDLILLSALVSPAEETALVEFLRTLPDAAHIQTLITPALGPVGGAAVDRGWLRWGSKRATPGLTAADEFRIFAERVAWSLELARNSRPVDAAPLPKFAAAATAAAPDATADLLVVPPRASLVRLLADVPGLPADRRIHRRFSASELHGLRSARIKFGPEVRLIDVSAGGVLLETEVRLRPESDSTLEIVGHSGPLVLPCRVLRCQLTSLEGQLRYRGACEFSTPLDLAELIATDDARAVEETLPAMSLPALAEALLLSRGASSVEGGRG